MSINIKSQRLQKKTRVSSLLLNSFLFTYFAIQDRELEYFVYFTNWGLFLTSLYFICAVYTCNYAEEEAELSGFFLVIWAFNWLITLAYWGYLYPLEGSPDLLRSSLTHSVPLISTMTEFSQFRSNLDRSLYKFPISALLMYLLCVLLPYTLASRPIYTGIDFRSQFSFVFCVGMLIATLVSLELARLQKNVKSRNVLIVNS